MIKVSLLYPKDGGHTFDMAYYCGTHIPLVQQKLGDVLRGTSVDQGLEAPGAPLVYLAMGHLLFDSVEAFQTAMATHGVALMADVPNYTTSQPVLQISEVKM